MLRLANTTGIDLETDGQAVASPWRCIACGADLDGDFSCAGCGRSYPEVDGIVHAIGPLRGTNRVAAAFYDGPSWPRFRPWEQLFLWFQGPGPARARRQVLRHLPRQPQARVLEVGIGAGANLPLLPPSWTIYGVDIAASQLALCRGRWPGLAGRLACAEAEALPFADATFDAVYTVGGFNYFSDPVRAIREMRRVARPDGPVIVADEDPDLIRFSPGRALGIDLIDRFALRAMGLDAQFIAMVQNHQLDIAAVARRACPGHRRFPIWNRLGYCLVDPAPDYCTSLEL
jgi:SAM-dependent methyltransferase